MSEQQTNNIQQATLSNGIILGLFAMVSTGLIAITNLVTKDKIAEEIQAALARRLNEIISADEYDNDVYHDCTLATSRDLLGSENAQKVYRMRNQGEDYALFMTTLAPDGYAGKISMVIGIYQNGEIAGVRVTEHQETPGLGDKIEIEKSDWIRQFEGLSLANTAKDDWAVSKDGGQFDALTGATITPRAIVAAVNRALLYFHANKPALFDQNQSCGGQK